MFGYEAGVADVLDEDCTDVFDFDASGRALRSALAQLADETGAAAVVPGVSCGGLFRTAPGPPRAADVAGDLRLTPARLCDAVAASLREGDILVDESITSGKHLWRAAQDAPRHTVLGLTGGAIGCGPPLAVGAAVACPDRRVVNLQADGSLCYSLPALWTQAREGLRVVTVVCANRAYQILNVEMSLQGAGREGRRGPARGETSLATFTSLTDPAVDFVAVARGMGVPGGRAGTTGELLRLLRESDGVRGPFLIEAEL